MELVVTIVLCVFYCRLFVKAGENPIYAFVPVLSTYTLCEIVDATWAFWGYVIGFVCYFMAMLSGMSAVANIAYLALMIINVIIYIRLILVAKDEPLWAIAMIVCEVLRIFVL